MKSGARISQIAPMKRIPTAEILGSLPLARAGEFELSDAEVRRTRSLIYSINRDNIRRYRTQREGALLMVWRIK